MEQPRRIGDYEVLGKLGRGGMGEVYKVRNVISDRIEAMKVLLPDLVGRQDLAARFLREIKVLAALDHPNIAALRTALTADNQLVMIMELVDGQSLSHRLSHGPLAAADAIQFIDQVLDALDYAHRQGVIHRDIKPANMMLTPQGVVTLTDFGIARSTSDHTLTATGATTGSLSYMSPEQVSSQATDARSDLYAVGVSLYEMVTGQLPFRAESDVALMFAHLEAEPKPPLELQPTLAPELNRIILKAMAKKPADRFQTAGELRAALQGVPVTVVGARRGEAIHVAPVGPPPSAVPIAAPPLVGSPAAGLNPAPVAVLASPPVPAIAAMSNTIPSPSDHSGGSGAHPPATTLDTRTPSPRAIDQMAAAQQAGPGAAVPPPRRVQGGVSAMLYVALGAFLVVAAVSGMAYYSRNAEATPSTTPTPLVSPPSSPPAGAATTPAPPTPAPTDPAPPDPAPTTPAPTSVDTQPTATASTADAAPRESVASGLAGSPPRARSGSAAQSPHVSGATRRATSQGTGARVPSEPVPAVKNVDPPDTSSTRDVPPRTAAPAAHDDDALDALEAELDQLSARATAINGSVDRLKDEQARLGYGLSGEMAGHQHSLNTNMTKANEALERKDLARARRFKALAETNVQFLEKAFGR